MNNRPSCLLPDQMSNTPPVGCSLSVGDRVIWTHEDDPTFQRQFTVTGFTLPEDCLHGRTVYLDWTSYWFPVRPETLRRV